MFTFVGCFRTRECSMSSLDLWISCRDSSRIRLVFSIAVLSIRSIETAYSETPEKKSAHGVN
jgi:hypothetical protein